MPHKTPVLLSTEGASQGADELDRLRETSDQAVGQAAREVAGLSPEEEEGRKRTHRDRRRAAWAQVETWAIRAVAGIGIAFALCVSALALHILWRWVNYILADSGKTDALVKGAVWTTLVAVATWGTNNVFKRDD